MEIFFGRCEIEPAFEALCSNWSIWISFDQFLNDLTGALQLLCVPQESGSADKVLIWGHVLALFKLKLKHVDGFLVDVAATLMVVD